MLRRAGSNLLLKMGFKVINTATTKPKTEFGYLEKELWTFKDLLTETYAEKQKEVMADLGLNIEEKAMGNEKDQASKLDQLKLAYYAGLEAGQY